MSASRRWLVAAAGMLSLGGCNQYIGQPGEWVPVDEVEGVLAPEYGGAPAGVPAMRDGRVISTDPLRVVTYNVYTGIAVEQLAETLRDDPELAAAGVLLIQEEEAYPEEGRSRTAKLADALGLSYVYVPGRVKESGTHGLAILSAFPITDVRVMVLPPGKGSRIVPRIAIAADILVGDKTLHVVNVHLDTIINATDRILQIRPAVIDAPASVLVAGDFNTNPYLWVDGNIPILPASSSGATDQAVVLDDYMRHLGFDTPTAGAGPTESMYGVETRLDSIYTRGLGVVGTGKTLRGVGPSDHWPVYVDLDL